MICPIPHDAKSVTVVFAVVGGGEMGRRMSVQGGQVYEVRELISKAIGKVKRRSLKHKLGNCLRIMCQSAVLYDYVLDHQG